MTRPEPETNSDPDDQHQGRNCEAEEDEEDEEFSDLEEYIPPYLRRFITPYHGEFCWTRTFHFRLVAYLMLEGFLPIANEFVLLPKLHHERCVIQLQETGAMHIPKSIRKKSKKFTFSVNQCFDRVVEECRKQHGPRCWLYPELVRVFREIHQAVQVDCVVVQAGPQDSNDTDDGSEDANETISHEQQQELAPVRLYSIEVWNQETGELAAGELGYTVGSIYTSLTGFSAQDSAGSVQLAALGRLLSSIGFTMWDLGMDMDYKQGLGSQNIPRQDFLAHVHEVRTTKGCLVLPVSTDALNCKGIIDCQQQTSSTASQQRQQRQDQNLAMVNKTSPMKGNDKAGPNPDNHSKQYPSHKPPPPDQGASPEPYKKKRRG
jgi:Leu/Phe-tRNA-protein transferase